MYPSWVRKPEDEERYVENYHAKEGAWLDRDGLMPNTAKRGLVKLFEFALG